MAELKAAGTEDGVRTHESHCELDALVHRCIFESGLNT